MLWFWLNVPLAVAFVGAWCGIPLAMVLRTRDQGPEQADGHSVEPAEPEPTGAVHRGEPWVWLWRYWHWWVCSASCQMNGRGLRRGPRPSAMRTALSAPPDAAVAAAVPAPAADLAVRWPGS